MGEAGLVGLAEALDGLALAPVADEIGHALWLRDRLDALISGTLRRFDADEAWKLDGSLSLTAWLAAHGQMSRGDAQRDATVARRLAALPVTAGAWADGTLSSGQVGAVVANVSAGRAERYAGHEADMTPLLADLSVADVALAMRSWRLHAEAQEDGPEPADRPSELYLSKTLDGRTEVAGHLSAEDAAVVEQAMAHASPGPAPNGDGAPPSAPQRRAHALADVCRWFLSHYDQASSGVRNRPQISVIVDLVDLVDGGPGRLTDGTAVTASTVARLACDSLLHRIVMSARSTILDYGTAVRSISPALWAALVLRDGHCRHPGCDRPPSWCEGHHVQHFSKGGPTCLSNIVLACTRHHHLWHDQGWALELSADATLTVTSPWGVVLTSRPPPAHLVA
jgi:hypothetical protein